MKAIATLVASLFVAGAAVAQQAPAKKEEKKEAPKAEVKKEEKKEAKK